MRPAGNYSGGAGRRGVRRSAAAAVERAHAGKRRIADQALQGGQRA